MKFAQEAWRHRLDRRWHWARPVHRCRLGALLGMPTGALSSAFYHSFALPYCQYPTSEPCPRNDWRSANRLSCIFVPRASHLFWSHTSNRNTHGGPAIAYAWSGQHAWLSRFHKPRQTNLAWFMSVFHLAGAPYWPRLRKGAHALWSVALVDPCVPIFFMPPAF